MALTSFNEYRRLFNFIYDYGKKFLISNIAANGSFRMALNQLDTLYSFPVDSNLNQLIGHLLVCLGSREAEGFPEENYRKALGDFYMAFLPYFEDIRPLKETPYALWANILSLIKKTEAEYGKNTLLSYISLFLIEEAELRISKEKE